MEQQKRKARAMTRQYIDENRAELRELYAATHRQADQPRHLTKKERKALGIGRDQGVAYTHNVRIAPIKANQVMRLIRNKNLNEAYAILAYSPKGIAPILTKLLKSAEANAVNNNELDPDRLYVASAYANAGPVIKRIRPRARGSADRILKRSSHLGIVVRERD